MKDANEEGINGRLISEYKELTVCNTESSISFLLSPTNLLTTAANNNDRKSPLHTDVTPNSEKALSIE
jgi:hypothetical protein